MKRRGKTSEIAQNTYYKDCKNHRYEQMVYVAKKKNVKPKWLKVRTMYMDNIAKRLRGDKQAKEENDIILTISKETKLSEDTVKEYLKDFSNSCNN